MLHLVEDGDADLWIRQEAVEADEGVGGWKVEEFGRHDDGISVEIGWYMGVGVTPDPDSPCPSHADSCSTGLKAGRRSSSSTDPSKHARSKLGQLDDGTAAHGRRSRPISSSSSIHVPTPALDAQRS